MSQVVVVAEFEFEEGKGEEAVGMLTDLCARTHATDSGCQLYALHRVVGDPDRVVFVEKWDSREALDRHIASDHARSFGAFDGFAGEPQVRILEPTGFGDPELGLV